METRLELTVAAEWANVRKVRERVGVVLGDYSAELRIATMMTASELVENAIKYGESVPDAPTVALALLVRANSVTIRVSNGSTNQAGVSELQRRVADVSGTGDPRDLYLIRLRELCLEPGDSGRLGIYRIACEGEFRLACEYAKSVVSVTATRDFHD